jgi:proton-translocating NADH-quinone oxidoreductase chain L
MLILLVSLDFFQLFLGWEGVGLSSFLLISFWFTRTQAAISALKAFIVNRVGDSFFFFGILLIGYLFGSINIENFCHSTNWINNMTIQFLATSFWLKLVLAITFLIGAMSKSAQILLHTWLPDAMEGPTPVSSLIHAATMVAAGIFLLARLSSYLITIPEVLVFFSIIGSVTAIFAATSGLFQHDIKKIIAYSTCSQLGFMMAAIGLGAFAVSLYHLVTHAFFKALLFLASGAIIHSLSDIQDIRRYGSLIALLPYSYVTTLIGSFALTGIPFFSGFYSKDLIIETAIISSFDHSLFSTIILIASSAFTMLYSVKLLYLTFFVRCNSTLGILKQVTESSVLILITLTILAVFSVVAGWYFKNLITMHVGFLGRGSFSSITETCGADVEFIPIFVRHSVLMTIIMAAYFGILFNISEPNIFNSYWPTFGDNTIMGRVTIFFTKKWYFDIIYNYFISHNSFTLGFMLLKNMELGFLEASGPYLLHNIVRVGGLLIETMHKKTLSMYLIYFFYSIALIVIFQYVNFYFTSIITLISILMLIVDSIQTLSINRVKKAFISMFHVRRLLFIQRNILKLIFFSIYVVLPAGFTVYAYMYVIYFLIYTFKYSEIFFPAWLF